MKARSFLALVTVVLCCSCSNKPERYLGATVPVGSPISNPETLECWLEKSSLISVDPYASAHELKYFHFFEEKPSRPTISGSHAWHFIISNITSIPNVNGAPYNKIESPEDIIFRHEDSQGVIVTLINKKSGALIETRVLHMGEGIFGDVFYGQCQQVKGHAVK